MNEKLDEGNEECLEDKFSLKKGPKREEEIDEERNQEEKEKIMKKNLMMKDELGKKEWEKVYDDEDKWWKRKCGKKYEIKRELKKKEDEKIDYLLMKKGSKEKKEEK